jgi:hypothetical protein
MKWIASLNNTMHKITKRIIYVLIKNNITIHPCRFDEYHFLTKECIEIFYDAYLKKQK